MFQLAGAWRRASWLAGVLVASGLLAGPAQARGVVVVAGGYDPLAAAIAPCASASVLLPAGGAAVSDCTAIQATTEAVWSASQDSRIDTINRLVSQTQEVYGAARPNWAAPFSDSGQVAAAQAGEPFYLPTGLTDFVEHAAAVDGSVSSGLFTLQALATPMFSVTDGQLRTTLLWDLTLHLNQSVSGPFILDMSGGTVYGDPGVNRAWRLSYLFEGGSFAAGTDLSVQLPALSWSYPLASPTMGPDFQPVTHALAGTLNVEHVALYLDPVTLAPVPEPATALLWAGGVALLGWARRRRG
ncbi:PEP-CTERM sorting domain-containing protein [Ideonella sp. DXS22W]|uniref:PEP-CTERM sorting domain-containing protein n=1 Tax=Pseudaquabacterium inlustre TaxID=2984192 RepID=A0ABU9CD62_9BURK